MGGGAFLQAAAQGQPTLRTPRMSQSEYALLKNVYTERLQVHFPGCALSSLLEAPEKDDYGDIDFIVSTEAQVDMTALAAQLGARAVIDQSSGSFQRCTLAVPKDGSKSEIHAIKYETLNNSRSKLPPSNEMSVEEYAQIDIEVIPPDLFDWHMFYASYGDMAGLLGKFVHYFGFTVTDKGLLLRLQELDDIRGMEYINIKDSSGKLFLSRDPVQVMLFLGFSPARFHKGFTTTLELYEWLGDCRLLSPDTVKYRRNNSHERNREKKRTVYTRFLEEWLPAHFGIEANESASDAATDDEPAQPPDVNEKRLLLRDEAVKFFDKGKEFEALHTALVVAIRNQTAAHLLRPILAQHSGTKDKKLNEILRTFRRWVVFHDSKPEIAAEPHTDDASQLRFWLHEDGKSLADESLTSAFVQANWEQLKMLERQRLKSAREAD